MDSPQHTGESNPLPSGYVKIAVEIGHSGVFSIKNGDVPELCKRLPEGLDYHGHLVDSISFPSSGYAPHKVVAEVSKIANYRRLFAVHHGSQSEPTDGPTSGWRQRSVVEVAVVFVAEMYL